ncbi:MAG: hypothetical protein MUF61_02700, partial [archaeon]|nr:hypothetical protein [archaeon]
MKLNRLKIGNGRKAQEEIVGFVLVVVIVAIIFLIFLAIFVRRPAPASAKESSAALKEEAAKEVVKKLADIPEYSWSGCTG